MNTSFPADPGTKPLAGAALRKTLTLASALLLAACASMRVGSDYDHAVSFSGYHSFALVRREHRGIQNPLAVTRAEDDIQQELQRRGFTLAADRASADFTVDFTLGAQERADISTYGLGYVGPWGGWAGPGWRGGIDVRQYHEGTLSIDIFDARTGRPVWRGWANKDLTAREIEQPGEPITKAVSSVLATFPPA